MDPRAPSQTSLEQRTYQERPLSCWWNPWCGMALFDRLRNLKLQELRVRLPLHVGELYYDDENHIPVVNKIYIDVKFPSNPG